MILVMALTWTLLGQSTGGFSGPSQTGDRSTTYLVNPWLDESYQASLKAQARQPVPVVNSITVEVGKSRGQAPAGGMLPGSHRNLDEVATRSHAILIGRLARLLPGRGAGVIKSGQADLQPVDMLRGQLHRFDHFDISITTADREDLPKVGEDYIFLVGYGPTNLPLVLKVLPVTTANVAAVKQAIRADDDQMLPNSRVPTAEARAKAHTIVVAEVKGGATTGAGAVSLGWCDLKVASTIKGEAKSVDGKRIGYTAYGGGMPPTVGQSYLFFIGKDHDLDAILKVMPASEATVRGLTNAEVGLRAVQAGVACRMQGDNLTIAAAGARSHTIIVAEIQGWVEIGAGGYLMAWAGFKVESTLKGELLPGDLKGFGWRPSDGESSPRVGESLLVFVGKSGQNFDTVYKFLPATAANIQEARDQIIAAGPPVATRPANVPGDGPAQAVSASRSPTRPE